MMTFSRRQWLVAGLAVLLLAGGLAVWLGGYGPEIGKFFAYEQPSGYVPVCLGYGERTVSHVGCCAGLSAKSPPYNGSQQPAICLPPECSVRADLSFDCPPDGPMGSGPGDADSDGDVDIFDYNLVVSNFGR